MAHFIYLTSLEIAIWMDQVPLNLWQSSSLCLPNTRVTGGCWFLSSCYITGMDWLPSLKASSHFFTGSPYVAPAGLDFPMQIKLASNFWGFSCFCLLRTGIIGLGYDMWHSKSSLINYYLKCVCHSIRMEVSSPHPLWGRQFNSGSHTCSAGNFPL